MAFEGSRLYQMIKAATQDQLEQAFYLLDNLDEDQVRLRSEKDNSSYYHHLVNCAGRVLENCGSLTPLLPLIYKMALKKITINAQNEHGNTCLHLACLRPHSAPLCEHFIRVGADPCIMNKKSCRVIHTVRDHRCLIVKGQSSAKSGLWNAVEKEDLGLAERLLRTWCRVNIRKNKSLRDVADETGNLHINKLLNKYERTNELAMYAFACDPAGVRELLRAGGADLRQCDESRAETRPLVVAVAELGDLAAPVIQVLKDHGQDPNEYQERILARQMTFENSDFYRKVEEASEESLLDALEIVPSLDVSLTSSRPDTLGWTYLHYVVDRYNRLDAGSEVACIIIRIIYKLALAGIDVHARDANNETALIRASNKLDQALMTHIIRIGGDALMTASDGRAVNEEIYEDKGKLVFDKKYRQADLPGLWVAIETNDVAKAERWLKSWARVNQTKGDRRMLEVARALKRTEIVKLLETYEHINEFVCATFACDLKAMMHLLALGKGQHKVNSIDDFFHVGFTWDRHAEFMPRPIIVSAMEICTPEVVDFLLSFGADLSREYEESYPCGPVAFWAFRDHIDNRNTVVVAKHADVALQDELGCTMLHKCIQKRRNGAKIEIVQVLLDRGINIAARDYEGSTARDYADIYDVEDADELKQAIDNQVLDLVGNDEHYILENLIIDCYDHIDDIRSTKKNKGVKEIAELKEFKEIMLLMEEYDKYKAEIALLHESAQTGDLLTISKLSGEKRCAWSRDLAGRTLLHNAVLYEQPDIVKFLVEQHPHLINSRDNILRTPLHYCVTLEERRFIWPILQDGGADPNLVDANNLSVYDYVRECETPSNAKDRPRGRRVRNYTPMELIETERQLDYGGRARRAGLFRVLRKIIKTEALSAIKKATQNFSGSLAIDDLDLPLLRMCIEEKREEVAKHLMEHCGARYDAIIQMTDGSKCKILDLVKKSKLGDLEQYINKRIKLASMTEEERQAAKEEQQRAAKMQAEQEAAAVESAAVSAAAASTRAPSAATEAASQRQDQPSALGSTTTEQQPEVTPSEAETAE